ncbi:MAG: hypothetical protein ABGW96_06005, partial [Methylophilaceae bacterium]
IIDTGEAVAKHLQATLEAQSLLTPSEVESNISIWTNNAAEDRGDVIQQLWGKRDAKIERIK